ncbi:hypothetical protein DRO56_01875 [Candidatus Bathyarchaeota archaeon]|nr:MAG: hypothetical protein DRO56_01875 [Candidatus Bathyarchaeota archaeon]
MKTVIWDELKHCLPIILLALSCNFLLVFLASKFRLWGVIGYLILYLILVGFLGKIFEENEKMNEQLNLKREG